MYDPTPRRTLDDELKATAQALFDCMKGLKAVFESVARLGEHSGVMALDYRIFRSLPYPSFIWFRFRMRAGGNGDPVCYIRDEPINVPDKWADLGVVELKWNKDQEPEPTLKEILYNEPGR